jgi:drug/metabolite transporter (DMT)-like permease
MSARTKAYILLLLVAAIWGFATPLVKVAFIDFPPAIFLTYRFFITSLIMIPLLLVIEPRTWQHLGELSAREWSFLFVGGVMGSTLQLGLLFWGLSLTSSLDASFIGATSPILVALAGHYILREHISGRARIGLAVAFLGSVIVIIDPIFQGQRLFSGNFLGNLLVLLGTLFWVLYIILTKQELRQKLSPLLLTTVMFFSGFVTMTYITFFLYRPISIIHMFSNASIFSHISVFYMAFISGAFAYWAYQKSQKSLPASKADIFLYLSPLFTVPLAFFWLGEPITTSFVIGSVIIALGVVVSQIKSQSGKNII